MNERVHNFVSYLERLAGEHTGSSGVSGRQALAALRRSFTTWPALPAQAIQIIAPLVPKQISEANESTYYLVAALFASHAESFQSKGAFGQSLGAALAAAAQNETSKGAERALLTLLRCKREDLPNHLRHTVSYLRARDVPVDYRRLMTDLDFWESDKSFVQRRWARDFWAHESEAAQNSTTQETQNVH